MTDASALAARVRGAFEVLGTEEAQRPGATEEAMAAALELRRALAAHPELADDEDVRAARALARVKARHLGVRLSTSVREIMRMALRERDADPWIAIRRLRSEIEAVLELVEPEERGQLLDDDEVEEADDFVREAAPAAAADDVPPGTPRSHWWWWYPAEPPPDAPS